MTYFLTVDIVCTLHAKRTNLHDCMLLFTADGANLSAFTQQPCAVIKFNNEICIMIYGTTYMILY